MLYTIIKLYNVPIIKNTIPSLVNSNILKVCKLFDSKNELTSKLVDVPIKVKVPPKIAA